MLLSKVNEAMTSASLHCCVVQAPSFVGFNQWSHTMGVQPGIFVFIHTSNGIVSKELDLARFSRRQDIIPNQVSDAPPRSGVMN
jgi:hypothetical protein